MARTICICTLQGDWNSAFPQTVFHLAFLAGLLDPSIGNRFPKKYRTGKLDLSSGNWEAVTAAVKCGVDLLRRVAAKSKVGVYYVYSIIYGM